MKKTIHISLTSIATALAFALPIQAQESKSSVSSLMEEITVTARKREESLQETPLAVSAFTGASLEARGIQKVDDIASITPNMTFDNINTNGGGGVI